MTEIKSLTLVDFETGLDLPKEEIRAKIAALEAEMSLLPQEEIPLKHHFSRAVYAREIFIPRGTLIVGKIHRHQNMNVISKGDVSFLSIDGVVRAKAPHTFVASPGVKRVIYAHEDTVWTTIHGTDETDLEKLEQEFIAKSYDELYLESPRSLGNALDIIGASPEELRRISENEDDQIDFPAPASVAVKDSPIEGKGIFAEANFSAGDRIAPARLSGFRTPAGRYSNHSGSPNAEMVAEGDDIFLVATTEIKTGDEILTDYFFNYKCARGS